MQDGNETNSQPLTGLPHLVASSVSSGDITSIDADTVVVNLFQGVTSPGGATGAVDRALGGTISVLVAAGDIPGKPGDVTVLYSGGAISARRVLVVGLGREEKFDLEAVRRAAARAALRARELGSERLATIAHGAGIGGLDAAQAAQATLEGALLARSEEHTSELQSRGHLVCRLLLEKKNNPHTTMETNIKNKTLNHICI